MNKHLIDKLNKKDKEELLSRIKSEKSKPYICFGITYVNYFLKYIILLSIVIPLWFIAFENGHIDLLRAGINLFMALGRVLIYVIIFGFIIDYFCILFRLMKISKIKKEYFNIVPKRK